MYAFKIYMRLEPLWKKVLSASVKEKDSDTDANVFLDLWQQVLGIDETLSQRSRLLNKEKSHLLTLIVTIQNKQRVINSIFSLVIFFFVRNFLTLFIAISSLYCVKLMDRRYWSFFEALLLLWLGWNISYIYKS